MCAKTWRLIGRGLAVTLLAWSVTAHAQRAREQTPAGATPAGAAPPGAIRLMTTDAIRAPLEAIRAQAERAIGHPLIIQYGSARGDLKMAILAGHAFDVAILLPDVNETLLAAGKIQSGSADIAKIDIAIGLRGEVPRIDVSTPAALKTAILNAKVLKWGNTGIAITTVNKILDTLEVREAALAKHQVRGSPPLASGEYELNFYPLVEILETEGLRNLGPVIPSLQIPGILSAVIAAGTTDLASARALVTFLQGPAIEPALKASGFTR